MECFSPFVTSCTAPSASGWDETSPVGIFTRGFNVPLQGTHNNGSERANRGPAVSRKNYYGSGSLWSGRLAAMMFSIIATLTRNQLNPRKWLTWYLESCAECGGKSPADIATFLPWNLTPQRRQSLAIDPKNTS